jgi:hypothetical protein
MHTRFKPCGVVIASVALIATGAPPRIPCDPMHLH